MIELNGKFNTAKVFTNNIDSETISQIINLLNQPYMKDLSVRIMPDCHAGAGCVIGTTIQLKDKVVPNLVGVDIGCFTGDTEIWCSSGSYIKIKDLVGKRFTVDSFDMEQKCFIISKATANLTRKDAKLVEVNYGNDKYADFSVRCTPDHKFLVSSNSDVYYDSIDTELTWIEAKDLKEGMRLVAEDAHLYVKSVKELKECEDVYCLTVDETHNFCIKGGVIVHNCGMLSLKLTESEIDFQKLDEVIQKYVPSGFNVHDEAIATSNIDKCIAPVNIDNAFKSLGTLGGGNHFIEVDKDENDDLWLVIHTGSRHLGIEICNYYQNLAYDTIKNGDVRKEGQDLIEKLKREGRQSEIENALKDLYKKERECKIPKELCYIEGDNFKNYIHDMHLAQEHAKINRQTIADQIIKHMDLHVDMQFDTIHNYIDIDNMILRKGSISAQKGEKVIIPMNMRDGSLICIGKGNPDWNYSAPHGAGRILSRSKAKEEVDLDDFKETMKGIYTSCVNYSTLDESPFVYKPADEIKENIQDTVEIISCIKPIYNFKAHDEVDKNLQVETDIEDELEL